MKKFIINLNKAFSLDKATIAKLSEAQMGTLTGGNGATEDRGIVSNTCVFASCNVSKDCLN
jgi:hypothetical protein